MKMKVVIMLAVMCAGLPGAVILTGSESEPVTAAEESRDSAGLVTVDLSPVNTFSYHHPPNDVEDWGERICAKLEPFYEDLSPHYQRKFDRFCGEPGVVPELKTAGLLMLGLALELRKKR